ncbi:MAG: hypothetical protein ACR2NE_07215, partial [Pirellulales bacterium]
HDHRVIPRVAVKVRCDRLRVPTQATDPVVQVIDGNKQNVVTRTIGLLGSRSASIWNRQSGKYQQIHAAIFGHKTPPHPLNARARSLYALCTRT